MVPPPRYGDAEVVLGSELRRVVESWMERVDAENPFWTFGKVYQDNFYRMSAQQWLAVETGYTTRSFHRILRSEYVGLRAADRILTAIDKSYMLVNGELTVIPNPKWSYEGWISWMEERGC